MAFTSGTGAYGHNHLLDLFHTWIVSTVGWTELEYTPANDEAVSVDSIAAGGTGYNVGDTITLTGGVFSTATVLQVDAVSSGPPGPVSAASIVTPGVYTTAPGDPVAQGSTSGSGSGATFNMTYEAAVDTDIATLSLEGPGNGAGSRVYVNIDTVNDVGNGFYGWRIYGATAYDSGVGFSLQENASPPVYLNLYQNSIDYWMQASSRHFKIEPQVSTNFMSAYAGFLLPGALPSEYPQPLAVIASYPELASASVANARNSSIADPGVGAGYFLRRSAMAWRSIDNHASSGNPINPSTGIRALMWPAKTGRGRAYNASSDPEEWNNGGYASLKPNFNGESPLKQCTIIDLVSGEPVGSLEGVYSVTGFGKTATQTVTYGGRTFRLFQRAGRSNPGDFYGVEET